MHMYVSFVFLIGGRGEGEPHAHDSLLWASGFCWSWGVLPFMSVMVNVPKQIATSFLYTYLKIIFLFWGSRHIVTTTQNCFGLVRSDTVVKIDKSLI